MACAAPSQTTSRASAAPSAAGKPRTITERTASLSGASIRYRLRISAVEEAVAFLVALMDPQPKPRSQTEKGKTHGKPA